MRISLPVGLDGFGRFPGQLFIGNISLSAFQSCRIALKTIPVAIGWISHSNVPIFIEGLLEGHAGRDFAADENLLAGKFFGLFKDRDDVLSGNNNAAIFVA
jgi:hypothetical protein